MAGCLAAVLVLSQLCANEGPFTDSASLLLPVYNVLRDPRLSYRY